MVSNEPGLMMKRALVRGLLVAIAVAYSSIGFTSSKPAKASAPLSADEVVIYQAILRQYSEKASSPLNVANTTVPLNPDTQTNPCLQGIKLENLPAASYSFHELTGEIVAGTNARLVDPKKHSKIVGLFSMSEIAFDKEHRNAVVGYSLWCGSQCGEGATVVFEQINGVWRDAHRNCGQWIF